MPTPITLQAMLAEDGRSVLERAHDQRRSARAILSDDGDNDPSLDKLGGLLDALAERGARANAAVKSITDYAERQRSYGEDLLRRAHEQQRSPWAILSEDGANDPTLDGLGALIDALQARRAANVARREQAEAEQRQRAAARQQAAEVLAAKRHREAEARAAEDARQLDALTAKLLAGKSAGEVSQ